MIGLLPVLDSIRYSSISSEEESYVDVNICLDRNALLDSVIRGNWSGTIDVVFRRSKLYYERIEPESAVVDFVESS